MHRLKSEKKLKQIAETYYTDAQYEERNDYISISQVGFMNEAYGNAFEVAVHIMLSSFNIHDMREDVMLKTFPINEDMLFHRFQFKSKLTDKRKKIKEALDSLEEKQVIKRVYLNDEDTENKTSMFEVYQNQATYNGEKKKTFFTILNASFNKMLSLEADQDKINSLAVYGAIATRMNRFKGTKESNPWSQILALMQVISFESMENIGIAIGIGRKAVSKYIDILIEGKIIAVIKVRKVGSQKGEWSNLYAKWHERALLRNYVSALTENEMPEDKKYLNIIDVWEKHTEAVTETTPQESPQNTTSEQLTPTTPKDSITSIKPHTSDTEAVTSVPEDFNVLEFINDEPEEETIFDLGNGQALDDFFRLKDEQMASNY